MIILLIDRLFVRSVIHYLTRTRIAMDRFDHIDRIVAIPPIPDFVPSILFLIKRFIGNIERTQLKKGSMGPGDLCF